MTTRVIVAGYIRRSKNTAHQANNPRSYAVPTPSLPAATWTIEDIGAAFVVIDSTGQQLAYVYSQSAS